MDLSCDILWLELVFFQFFLVSRKYFAPRLIRESIVSSIKGLSIEDSSTSPTYVLSAISQAGNSFLTHNSVTLLDLLFDLLKGPRFSTDVNIHARFEVIYFFSTIVLRLSSQSRKLSAAS